MREHKPAGLQPVEIITLPLWPQGHLQPVRFYDPTGPDGRLAPWLSAGSVLDEPANWCGVYLIHDREGIVVYCGSSAGSTYQGQLRRTIEHHLGRWERRDGRQAGWTIPRQIASVAAFPLPQEEARIAEDYTIGALWSYADGLELAVANENSVFSHIGERRAIRPSTDAPF